MDRSPSSFQELDKQYSELPDAERDSLTGLANRLWIDTNLHEILDADPGKTGLVFIDLDGLKEANDTGGHNYGDTLIIDTAHVINGSVRHNGSDRMGDVTAVRPSGDEFIIVLRNAQSQINLDNIVKRIRDNLETANIKASLGSKIHEAGETAEDLKARADQAMRAEKQLKKVESLTPEQRNAAKVIGKIALENGLSLRDLPTILEFLTKQSA
jgi:diguanylate cyclase (GGDEF)-like protein